MLDTLRSASTSSFVCRTMTVKNPGNATLSVSNIASSDGQFTISPTSFNVSPGDSQDVEICFTPSSEGTHYSTLAITSNDVDAPTVNLIINGIGEPPVDISIPDTVAAFNTAVQIPVRIQDDVTGEGIVAAEIQVAYDSRIGTPATPFATDLDSTLAELGWSIEENIFPGSGDIDTLSLAMSTGVDTLSGSGALVYLLFETADIRHPASTALELVRVLFNNGTPGSAPIDGSLTLIGTDGTVDAAPDSIIPRQTVTISVNDADENRDTGVIDSVLVLAFDVVYNDSQYVWIPEDGVNTGTFTGTLSTEFDAVGGTSFDGVIGTIAGDSVFVNYVDSLDAIGATVARPDTVPVIGGVDGQLFVSYVVQSLDGRHGLRDTVRVRVDDSDLDTDDQAPDQAPAVITHTASAEVDSVWLLETGNNTGIFQIRLPTVEGASGTNNDGILTLTGFDTLLVTYEDTLTALGGTETLEDTTRVIKKFGDVDRNDEIQAFDASPILQTAVGLGHFTALDTLVADVDGDNEILAADASLVLQYVVRLIDRFPVQTDTIATPEDLKNHPFEKPVPIDRVIALGDFQMQVDGTYLVPIRLGERRGILSGTLHIGYDAGVEVLGVTTDAAYSRFLLAHNVGKEGVRIAFAGSQSEVQGPGEIFYLKVRSAGDVSLRLSLDQVHLNGRNLTPEFAPEVTAAAMPEDLPLVFALHQNHPNPFNPQTTITYDLPKASQVKLVIYNVMGQTMRTLVGERQEAGIYQVIWDGKDSFGREVGSGVYLVQMHTGRSLLTRKMLLLR